MITREDIMRELELLPVWQLRAPVLLIEQPAEKNPVELDTKIETTIEVSAQANIEAPVEADANVTSYEIIVSDDNKWAFICAESPYLHASQGSLFNNILLALHINKTHTIQAQDLANIGVGVVVVMGESAAQSILKTDATLETLRGKTHVLHDMPLIVTYHPQDLLLHLPYKAKTWDDLCSALSSLKD